MASTVEPVKSRVVLHHQRRHGRWRRVVFVSRAGMDATRHVLWRPDWDEAHGKVGHSAGMRVSRCDQRKRVLQKQTCKRRLCSSAISGIGKLPTLLSPSEVIAVVYEHETCIAGCGGLG
jgi:hypothetical protein